uniref:U3-theraphotoxin-Lsp1a n=1 Tax=Lasiodora sp. (strain IBSP 8539) TaxID=300858 RepID=TXTR3_LASSB|nr:RecName: Full=U3-theraphotoxin-Lsp1a; Short=U3-TRTX-Lsp1a; AltName: Full=LTx5; Flags: Precursor [Lasiodora sp. IBSP 8539]ABN13624.1 LTx5 toxin [Lasiodora sp. IBSP 8539]
MKLSTFIIMISLAVALATWPSEHIEGSDSETKLNVELGPYALADRAEKGKDDSLNKGEPCQFHCECRGASVLCEAVYGTRSPMYKCMIKRLPISVLDIMYQAERALEKLASSFRCE